MNMVCVCSDGDGLLLFVDPQLVMRHLTPMALSSLAQNIVEFSMAELFVVLEAPSTPLHVKSFLPFNLNF